jgi:hypothetical protein
MEESLVEELTGLQLVKKLLTFYGTLRFITAFIGAHHLSLSCAYQLHSCHSQLLKIKTCATELLICHDPGQFPAYTSLPRFI